jgi:dihydrofolate reductase
MAAAGSAHIILLAAVAHGNVIGVRNTLPWHLPEDLKRFKALTTGHTVAMGRKTFDSIVARLGKPLPNRHNVVLTRDRTWSPPTAEQVVVVHSPADLLRVAPGPLFVIGGAEVYAMTIDSAHELDITEVDLAVAGDAFFPAIDPAQWTKEAGSWQVSERDGLRYRFVTYRRKK